MAKKLASKLGFEYLDTGALYRAVGLALVQAGVKPEDSDEKIKEFLDKGLELKFKDGKLFLNGKDVSQEIRTKEAGHYSSVFSARKPVREFLLPLQRKLGKEGNLVAEGRDMTTTVFPNAWKKFYLDASVEERARRRYDQLRNTNHPMTMEEARNDVLERDRRDSTREISPLTKSTEAICIDSTRLSSDQVIYLMLEIINKD